MLHKIISVYTSKAQRCTSILVLLNFGFHSSYLYSADYFDPAFLTNNNAGDIIDLSAYENEGQVPEGKYLVDIYINQKHATSREVRFSKSSDGDVVPELSPKTLESVGIAVDRIPSIKHSPPTQAIDALKTAIPYFSFYFDLSKLRLDISVPQIYIDNITEGSVDPELLDNGIPALLLNYNLNGSKNWTDREDKSKMQSLFGSFHGGMNLGPWRLRSSVTYSDLSLEAKGISTTNRQASISNTYLQRDVQALQGEFTVGETSTGGDVFDSIPFSGVKLVQHHDMLSSNQRGFAPVLSGIANSNAQVNVTQNGNLIYQTNVAPGPFRISDIYQASSGGDLVMTITEADGSKRVISQAYSSLPIMKRPGGLDYEVTLGRYNNGRGYTTGSRSSPFFLGTLAYGLPSYTTLYGGLVASNSYLSVVTGSGLSLGKFGAMSVDLTTAKTKLSHDDESNLGTAFRARYSKSMLTTGTTFDLTTYRYATKNFYSFSDVNTFGYDLRENFAPWTKERKRSSVQSYISQSMGNLGTLNFRAGMDNYWGSDRQVNSLSAGFSSSFKGVGYSANYTVAQTLDKNGTWPTDRQISLSVNIPLSLFSSKEAMRNTSATYATSRDDSGRVNTQVGLSGSMFDNTTSWSASQSTNNQVAGTSGNIGVGYRGDSANVNMGYGYSGNLSMLNASANGAMVFHSGGLGLTPYLGNSVVLISAPGVAGVKVSDTRNRTNSSGYALSSSVQNYRRNSISLDPSTLPDGADIINNSLSVYPTKGAVVLAKFKTRIGHQAMFSLSYLGKPVPFGATVILKEEESNYTSIVGDAGMVYLSGLPLKGELSVQWGSHASKQCKVHYDINDQGRKDTKIFEIVQKDLLCQ